MGSSQLIQAALYALADPLDQPDPISVVSAAPFYSGRSHNVRAVHTGQMWVENINFTMFGPQNLGSRIGAIVKDTEVAKKMVKFIEINTIGVSKEAQLRAASILEKISAGYHGGEGDAKLMNFFGNSQFIVAEWWRTLREALSKNEVLQVRDFPPQYCNFNRVFVEPHPAYAWVKSQPGVDAAKALGEHKIRVRSGTSFGTDVEHARISMLGREGDFDMFMLRLPTIMHQLVALNSK